jgi:hypothetical protein
MAVKRFRDRFGRGEQMMPGSRINPSLRSEGPMSQPAFFTGQHGGPLQDFSQFNDPDSGRVMGGNLRQDLPGRRIDTSHRAAEMDARMSQTLEARRQAKLTSADPGLSTRGRVGSPGRGGRPVGGGLEGRGTRAATGTRMAPGPMLGPGRTEMINARRNAVRGNVNASRKAREASKFRNAQGFIGMHGPGRSEFVKANVDISRNARTGGFRDSGVGRRPPMGPDASGGDLPGRADAPRNPRGSGGIMRGLRNMSSRNKLMMGGGALVLGAAAYSGRRGDGTSSGRSGMTRY